MHLGFVNLCTTVVYDDDITNYMSEAKMAVQMIFINLFISFSSILRNFENTEEKLIFSFCILRIYDINSNLI